MQLASYLERGPLMWMMPLHLHVNQKSDYDYDDDDMITNIKFSNYTKAFIFGVVWPEIYIKYQNTFQSNS